MVMAALLANIIVAVVKGVAAFFTGSGAMLAETIHSMADSGNQALLLLGNKRAQRPPDSKHPFGYGSERYFWAFIVALMLFSMGALFSLYKGFSKLMNPSPIENVAWAYGVLFAALVIEITAFLFARRAMLAARGSQSFVDWFLLSKDPAVPVVYLEDSGAVVGLVLALAGVSCSHLLGWEWADAAATVGVGAVLLLVAVALLVRCHRLLIGESVTPEDQRAILRAVQSVEGVGEIVNLQTLHHGPETVIVIVDVRLEGGGKTVDAIEAAIREALPTAKHIAIEPV